MLILVWKYDPCPADISAASAGPRGGLAGRWASSGAWPEAAHSPGRDAPPAVAAVAGSGRRVGGLLGGGLAGGQHGGRLGGAGRHGLALPGDLHPDVSRRLP